jgi:TctA family transporter
MSEILAGLWLGLSVAATPYNLLFCFVGCLLGTLIGVLPGVGPLATLAMLLPFTFHFPPVSALIMLAGIFYGAQYGGSTTSILVNLPGEATSVVTCLDGYAMARQGRAGAALAIAALGSLFAGTVTTLVIAVAAPALGQVALLFTPPEYVALMCLGLIAAVVLAHGSVVKAVMMVLFGLFLGLIGTDVTIGETRFTFDIPQLFDGIEFVPIAMGMFGLAEIMNNLETPEDRTVLHQKIERLWPTREDFRSALPAIVRGTVLGNVLGILPGGEP